MCEDITGHFFPSIKAAPKSAAAVASYPSTSVAYKQGIYSSSCICRIFSNTSQLVFLDYFTILLPIQCLANITFVLIDHHCILFSHRTSFSLEPRFKPSLTSHCCSVLEQIQNCNQYIKIPRNREKWCCSAAAVRLKAAAVTDQRQKMRFWWKYKPDTTLLDADT